MTDDERCPTHAPAGAPGAALREAEWGRRLAALVLGWTAFETLSGLALWILPFSVPNEWMVIVHTGAGLLFLVPALVYQARHLAITWSRPASAIKWMGWLATAAMLVAIASGGVLTWQALAGPRLGAAWHTAHLVSTVAVVAFLVPHVLVVLLRDRRVGRQASAALLRAQRRALVRAAASGAFGFALVAFAFLIGPQDRLADVFPADYSRPYGADRPFAPSLARTASGGAYDARSFSGSASCGTAGCHSAIAAEWSVSAHRWAAMDPGFQRIQEEMAKQNGAESTRYCGGCHDPISLFSGSKMVFTEHLTASAGYDEGVACLVCHSVRSTDLQGNAHYVVAQPRRYLFEQSRGAAALRARDFLIRAYPWQHRADLSKRLFKTPEYCAACHKQFIDREVNNVGWVQLQNQYDNWRKSRWNHPGDPTRTIECRECHMPLVASTDPAAGDEVDSNRSAGDGRHRSHRFIAANQFIPSVLKLPGAEEQVRLTERWLRGELPVPEIAAKWATGPAVALELAVPPRARPGEPVAVRAVITSNKVGHDFPTGPLDIIQSWVELTARDDRGRIVFHTGQVDDRHFIEPGTFMFKAEPVDQYGNLIDRHNLWEMVGVRYRRSLFPGFSDTAEFAFRCPGGDSDAAVPGAGAQSFAVPIPAGAGGHLTIEARLLYRKIDQYLLNFMFGSDAGLTAPVTEMARATATIPLADAP
ncbi:MAG TPA: multiheme c-type cytochrome [Candidatus Polarisedimenticolia bacterium]|nr:multiheme c-type cytochrome [Candidatus Polarisedimenticolia bacterium]